MASRSEIEIPAERAGLRAEREVDGRVMPLIGDPRKKSARISGRIVVQIRARISPAIDSSVAIRLRA
ncbi:hypothetical protein ACFS3B_10225 [Brucella rhizosphaerae]|uniref:hypothetical protein n=1 Tax=Brucella rhizosphaerae TaxID=571254 RepID=UPI00362F0101